MSKPLRVALFGAKGRMGREIQNEIAKGRDYKLAAALDKNSMPRSPDFDVLIDFSSPEGAGKIASWCAQNKTPLVTGTTGLNAAQSRTLAAASRKTPILVSPNMSVGVNAMAEALKIYAKSFGEGEVECVEIHHKHKKDKPSGTAKFLMSAVRSGAGKRVVVSEPVSLRGGDVFGIHKVYFFSEGEWVCFEHQATGRAVFARGALRAASWLVGRGPGLYSMADLLNE